MIKRKVAFLVLLVTIFISCTSKKSFVNNSGSCKLYLYNDSLYTLKYPIFIGSRTEKGVYKISDNLLHLTRLSENSYDSIDYSVTYYPKYPDTLSFSFRNLNNSSIYVEFTINDSPIIYESDNFGILKLPYKDLFSNNVISNDSTFHLFNILFNNNTYQIKDKILNPSDINIKLNQFIGNKNAILYRKFTYVNDTITVNGLDRKAIGSDIKLIQK